MKKLFYCLLSVLFIIPPMFAQNNMVQINVMTFNIRLDHEGDGDNQWTFRKDFAADVVKFYQADLIGTQEVLHHQLTDMLDRLPDYAHLGVGREDGMTKGEYSAILYKKDRFDVVRSGTFWLGEDITAVGVKGWDAACERVATWAVFTDKKTGKDFFMLNTHFDHIGKVARRESSLLLLSQVEKLAGKLPIIVTGDFNATPEDEPIKILTDTNDSRHLTPSRSIAALRYGPEWTFHNFGRIPFERRNWIDYIFVKGDIKALSNGVITDTKNHLFPSDHCPVIATLIF